MDLKEGSLLGATDVLSINVLKYADSAGNDTARLIGTAIGAWQYWMFSQGLATGSMIKKNMYWDVISDILVTISGIMIWQEEISTINAVGIGLGIASIYMMNL